MWDSILISTLSVVLTKPKTSPRHATTEQLSSVQRGILVSRSIIPGSRASATSPPYSIAARCARKPDPMHLAWLQRPLQRAAASSSRPFGAVLRTTTTSLEDRFAHLRIASPTAANAAVLGKRYASVKSQGAYKVKPKKTIPKKLGAKKTGGMS